jgi:hypothetical protein
MTQIEKIKSAAEIVRDDLLPTIEAHLRKTGIGPTTFGKRAVGNSELVARLRSGKDVTVSTANRVLSYIAQSDDPAGVPNNDPDQCPQSRIKSSA